MNTSRSFLAAVFALDRVISLISGCLITISLLIMAFTLNGEWLVVTVHILKQFNLVAPNSNVNKDSIRDFVTRIHLQDAHTFWISAMLSGYGIYFTVCGFFHWYYYRRQKDHPETWKCQPTRWLPAELELDEIKCGCVSLLVTNTSSALLACYIYNGGYSTVYYKISDYGLLWWILQWPVVFIYQDYTTYWVHRMFHTPLLYAKFHKMHHKYKQPTPFSVTAIHPVEISCIQLTMVLPLFVIPVHWFSFYSIAIYTYYHGIVTHSGINLKAQWWQPWQPDAIFHDNHHQYFHVNFGFNCFLWDKIHGTYRQADRVYNENIYYGKGKAISELNEEELKREMEERLAEGSTSPYVLDDNKLCILKSQSVVNRCRF